MSLQRLDKILSNRGYCTRSQARPFLRNHIVQTGAERLNVPDTKVSDANLTVDGEAIDPASLLVLLHKPVGHVCSHKEQGSLVYDLLPHRWMHRNPQIATVGRLDKETSGLLLLTDDGALLHRLTSPKNHVPRVYVATLDRALRGDEAAIFASGALMLESETKPLLAAELEALDDRLARVTLHEGRYHQVRRMFAAVGNHVTALHRERFGKLELGNLQSGEYRVISDAGL